MASRLPIKLERCLLIIFVCFRLNQPFSRCDEWAKSFSIVHVCHEASTGQTANHTRRCDACHLQALFSRNLSSATEVCAAGGTIATDLVSGCVAVQGSVVTLRSRVRLGNL